MQDFNENDYADQFFGNLDQSERKYFMEVCYEKILAHPKLLIDNSAPIEVKQNSINVLIKYFEGEEEYEKCARLKKLIRKL